jgi:hypothetical protein
MKRLKFLHESCSTQCIGHGWQRSCGPERQPETWRAKAAGMATERAAALTDTASAGVEADPGLNPADQPETDQPGAKPAADPTAAVAMRRNRNASAETQRLYAAIGGHSRIGAASEAWSRWRPTRPRLRPF